MNWLIFALMTVVSWGLYGVFLHSGQTAMLDKNNGLYKAFLFVWTRLFFDRRSRATRHVAHARRRLELSEKWNGLVALCGDRRRDWGVLRVAGIWRRWKTGVVMSIVFAGAPVVNAVVNIYLHPPQGGIGAIKPQFFLGILLAALGGCLVSLYKPNPAPHKPAPTQVASAKPNHS